MSDIDFDDDDLDISDLLHEGTVSTPAPVVSTKVPQPQPAIIPKPAQNYTTAPSKPSVAQTLSGVKVPTHPSIGRGAYETEESDLDLANFFPDDDEDSQNGDAMKPNHKANNPVLGVAQPNPSPVQTQTNIQPMPGTLSTPAAHDDSADFSTPMTSGNPSNRPAASTTVPTNSVALKASMNLQAHIASDDLDDDELNGLLQEVNEDDISSKPATQVPIPAAAAAAAAAVAPPTMSVKSNVSTKRVNQPDPDSDSSLSLSLDDGLNLDEIGINPELPTQNAKPVAVVQPTAPETETEKSGSVSRIQPRARRQPVQITPQQQQSQAEPASQPAAIQVPSAAQPELKPLVAPLEDSDDGEVGDEDIAGMAHDDDDDEFVLGSIDGLDFSALQNPVGLDFLSDAQLTTSISAADPTPAQVPPSNTAASESQRSVTKSDSSTVRQPTPPPTQETKSQSSNEYESSEADKHSEGADIGPNAANATAAESANYSQDEASQDLMQTEMDDEANVAAEMPVVEEMSEEEKELARLKSLPSHELVNFTPLLQAVLNGYQNLRILSLNNCFLQELPASIPANLEVLDISYNNFTSLSNIAQRCPSLVVLIARGNALTSLQGLEPLSNSLRALDVSRNPGLKSPAGLASFTHLQSLNLGWTGIATLQSLRSLSLNANLRELVLAGSSFADAAVSAGKQYTKVVVNFLPQLAYLDGNPLESPISQSAVLFGHSSIATVAAATASDPLLDIGFFHDAAFLSQPSTRITPTAAAAATHNRVRSHSRTSSTARAGLVTRDALIHSFRAVEITYDPDQDEPLPEDLAADPSSATAAVFLGRCEDDRITWLPSRTLDWPPALDASAAAPVLCRESMLDQMIAAHSRPFTDPAFHPNPIDIIRATELWTTQLTTWKKLFNRYTSTLMPTPVVTSTSATIADPNRLTMELVQFVKFIRAFGISPRFLPDTCVCGILQIVAGPAALKPRTAPVLSFNHFLQFLVRVSLYVAYRVAATLSPVPTEAPASDLALSVTSAKASDAVRRAAMDATLGSRVCAGTICPDILLEQAVFIVIRAVQRRVTDAASAAQQTVPTPEALFERIRKQTQMREERMNKMREDNYKAMLSPTPITQFTFQAVPLNNRKSQSPSRPSSAASSTAMPLASAGGGGQSRRSVTLNRSHSLRMSLLSTPRSSSPSRGAQLGVEPDHSSSPSMYRNSVATSGRGFSFGGPKTGRDSELQTTPSPTARPNSSPRKSRSMTLGVTPLPLSQIPQPSPRVVTQEQPRRTSRTVPETGRLGPAPNAQVVPAASVSSESNRTTSLNATVADTPQISASELAELLRRREEDRQIIEQQRNEVEEIKRQLQQLLVRSSLELSASSVTPTTHNPAPRHSISEVPEKSEVLEKSVIPKPPPEDSHPDQLDDHAVDDSTDDTEALRMQLLESIEADLLAPQEASLGIDDTATDMGLSEPPKGTMRIPQPPSQPHDDSADLELDLNLIDTAEKVMNNNPIRAPPVDVQPESSDSTNHEVQINTTGAGEVYRLDRRRSSLARRPSMSSTLVE